VSSSKREREYARKRYEKWQQRQAAHREQRRRRIVASVVVVVLVLGLGVGVVFALQPKDTPAGAATPSGSPSVTAPAATVPDPALAEGRTWTGSISTTAGKIGIELDGAAAPQAVANFVTLAQDGFFDGTSCHRLVTGGIKVLQCGSPDGTGNGGPGYSWGPIENAPADNVYPAGTIAMARVPDNGSSMGSQFFLVYQDSTIPADSAGGYTVFGHITSGLDVLTAVADAGVQGGGDDGPPVTDVTIQGVETQ